MYFSMDVWLFGHEFHVLVVVAARVTLQYIVLLVGHQFFGPKSASRSQRRWSLHTQR